MVSSADNTNTPPVDLATLFSKPAVKDPAPETKAKAEETTSPQRKKGKGSETGFGTASPGASSLASLFSKGAKKEDFSDSQKFIDSSKKDHADAKLAGLFGAEKDPAADEAKLKEFQDLTAKHKADKVEALSLDKDGKLEHVTMTKGKDGASDQYNVCKDGRCGFPQDFGVEAQKKYGKALTDVMKRGDKSLYRYSEAREHDIQEKLTKSASAKPYSSLFKSSR